MYLLSMPPHGIVADHQALFPPCRPAMIGPAVFIPSKNAKETSRVEVLLAQKTSKQVFKATEESAESQATNKAIKHSALWTDVQKAITHVLIVTPGNASYALHRLGCLNCFVSRKRKAGMPSLYPPPALPQQLGKVRSYHSSGGRTMCI